MKVINNPFFNNFLSFIWYFIRMFVVKFVKRLKK